jgi:hypothetical protein
MLLAPSHSELVEPRHHHQFAGRGQVVEHLAKLNTPLCHKLPTAVATHGNRYQSPHPGLRDGHSRSHIGAMNLDLSDQETAALTKELHEIVENDRYPFSPRIRTLRAILAKLRPEPVPEPLPLRKVYAPPRAVAARRRRRG